MRLSDEQVQQYLDDGFLVVEDVFTRQELQPVLDDFEVMVDGWADKLYAGGKIADKHEGEDVYTRLASLEKEWPNAAALVHWREGMRPTLSKIWASDNLLDMVEQFIGPDIVGHPVSVIRTKTPDTALMTVPWHQDSAYFLEGGEDTFQPTAWIPFVDATAENGTLQVFRGSHKLGRVLPHHFEKDIGHQKSWYLYIKDEDLPDAEIVTCEMNKGLGAVAPQHDDPPFDREPLRQGALERRPPLPAAGGADRLSRGQRAAADAQIGRSRLPPGLGGMDRRAPG